MCTALSGWFVQRSRFLWFAVALGLSTLSTTAHSQKVDPTCPFPTIEQGRQCVLKEDAALPQTLELGSNTMLNCQGHALTPIARGIVGDPNTRSTPEAAIFLRAVHSVSIQNCRIDGFDFGVLAMDSKLSADIKNNGVAQTIRNRVRQNTINVRFIGVHLMSVDNTEVANNEIRWFTLGGAGILVHRDSDLIDVRNNRITGDFPEGIQGARLVPGPTGVSNPVLPVNGAVVVTQVLGTHPTLINVVVNNRLYQVTSTTNAQINEDFTGDTLVSGNEISYTGSGMTFQADDGVVLVGSLRARVINNTIGSGRVGVRDGAVPSRQFAGKCTADASRSCLSSADCLVPGIDAVSKGACLVPPVQAVNWTSIDASVKGNRITGPFNLGIGASGHNFVIQENTIRGPMRTAGISGIRLLGDISLETAVVAENSISDVSNALALETVFMQLKAPRFFGAKVTQNNFSGYVTSVRTSNDYVVPTELSVLGKGNYWGLECVQGGFDPTRVRRADNTVNSAVHDSHPYGQPVASAGALSQTCF